jgi:hypothetical protein
MDRLLGWWYAIAVPPQVSEDAPLHQRTFIQKSKFTSIILLIEIIYHILYLYVVVVLVDATDAIIPISMTITAFIVGIVLNRLGKRNIANLIAFVAIEIDMTYYFISQSYQAGGFSLTHFALLSMLISPDIIAISLFPSGVALSLGLLNCLYVIVALAFFPKTPDMIQQMADIGAIDYYEAVAIQVVAILVSLFWVRSTNGEMDRANQAEEMNNLIQELATQQQSALEEKRQLEESIQHIVTVHTQVANGNLNARVPLDQTNILWSIAGSLNNLLARLQSWRQEVQHAQHIERSLQQALHDIRQAKAQGTLLTYRRTGTTVDLLVAEFMGGISPDHLSHQYQDKMTPIPGLPFQQQDKMKSRPDLPFQQQDKMKSRPDLPFQQQDKMKSRPDLPFQQQDKMKSRPDLPFQQS